MWTRSGAKRTYSSGVVFEYQFYCSFILVAMLDTVVAMPDVVVAIVTAKKLTEKGLPNLSIIKRYTQLATSYFS
jgi:hypothetical protein